MECYGPEAPNRLGHVTSAELPMMVAGAGPDLVVRIVESKMAAALARPHVRPMNFTGRPLRGFVFVSQSGCRPKAALKTWLAEGLRFVEHTYQSDNCVTGDARKLFTCFTLRVVTPGLRGFLAQAALRAGPVTVR